jgi:hypothetical protein
MFGWSAGWLALGGRAVGFDIEHLPHHGPVPNGAELVLQDVLTLHGRQFKDAALILASPPCQNYSYMAMPWKRGKAIAKAIRDDQTGRKLDALNALFNACFRIQAEASESAGRHIPMVVENVKGAQAWVGSAAWHFGSYFLWGDVPALMPFTRGRKPDGLSELNAHDGPRRGRKNLGGSWFAQAHNTESGHSQNPVTGEGIKQGGSGEAWFDKALDERRKAAGGLKAGGDWFGTYAEEKAAGTISPTRLTGKHTTARKAASAQIAKIPFELASYIARVFKP